ncbi:hypothetical protein [Novosphingobium sp. B 225]|uniref:hypothetical protein n=1 Tax=Novosphingobium sp. B 225 TaxID=1961849 RepID=UPI000B4AAD08|nr:hypothetical protein [Novosphingobium sp. B 225]
MKRVALPLIIGLMAASPAWAAGDMSVAAFLAKADALKAKGAMALFSPDIKVLQQEGQAAGMAYKAQLEAERAAGRPSSCPPKGVKVSSDQVLNHLRTYPTDVRPRVPMRAAIGDLFKKTWPCR